MLFANHRGGGARPPGQAGAIVVVFTIPGCPACEDYIPQFQQVAGQYPTVQSYVIDASTQQGGPYADRFGVEATPTTMVLRNPTGAIKTEGALDIGAIHHLFGIAAAQR
jgi:thiol-disulfide isomerase/thioredoxin